MKSKLLVSLFLGLFAFTTSASAEWLHQKLELVNEDDYSDKIIVSVDYEVKLLEGSLKEATPVHVNVWKQRGFAAGGQAIIRTLVFNDYVTNYDDMVLRKYEYFLKFKSEQTIDLRAAGSYLTGEAYEPIYLNGKKDVSYSKYFPQGLQEIAIVIDGKWYKGYNGLDARFSMFKLWVDSKFE